MVSLRDFKNGAPQQKTSAGKALDAVGGNENLMYQRLSEAGQPSKIVDFVYAPNQTMQVMLKSLTADEVEQAHNKATKQLLDAGMPYTLALFDSPLWINTAVAEILTIAVRDPEDEVSPGNHRRVFVTSKQLKSAMTNDQIGTLYALYSLMLEEYGEDEYKIDPDEVEEWVALIAKGGEANLHDFLSRLPLSTIGAIITSMARVLTSVWDFQHLDSQGSLMSMSETLSKSQDTESGGKDASESTPNILTRTEAHKIIAKQTKQQKKRSSKESPPKPTKPPELLTPEQTEEIAKKLRKGK